MKAKTAAKSPTELNEEFLKAAGKGDLKAIRKWIADGMPVIWPGSGNTTALIRAAENGQADAVKILIEAGADLNKTTTGRWTAIALAAARGHEDVVRVLLESGADPNAETKLGDTPLSLAIKSGKKRLADLLQSRAARLATSKPLGDLANQCVQQFAKSRKRGSLFGSPPTSKQRENAAKEASRLLQGIDKMVQTGAQGGDYALWSAAAIGYGELVARLLKAKANPNFAPHISSALANACEHGHLEIVRKLLDAGANINYGGTGWPPILEAAKHNHAEIVAELIRRGANVNTRARLGPTPLLLATTSGNLHLMRVLLDGKADASQTGTVEVGPRPKPTVEIDRIEGSKFVTRTTHSPGAPQALDVSPLVVAARRSLVEAVKLLVERGADLEVTDKEGLTALAWARKLRFQQVQELLLRAGANASVDIDGSLDNALIVAAATGKLDHVRQLLTKGAGANTHLDSVEERKTPLAEATKAGHAEIVRALLAAEAEVDKPVGKRLGVRNQTALMLAAEAKHPEVVEILLKAKADLGATDAEIFGGGGNTPLHYAAMGGSKEVIELLLEAGAGRSVQNKSRQTPLQIASSHGHRKAIDLLLASGSRVVSRKGNVSRMLHDAAFSGNAAAVKRLLKANPKAHGHDINFASTVCFGVELDILKVLVDSDMPVEGKDRGGETPLMQAVRAGRKQVVKFLLSRGANPKAVSNERKTPLSIAREYGHKALVRLLEKKRKAVKT